MAGAELGRVVAFEQGLRWRVLFPADEHVAASGFLRDLAASDCSPATLRSYAYDLLRWFRFLHGRWTAWERALVAVQRRAKGRHDQVPLSVRYDPSEKVHGEPFPHLFECSKEIWEAVSDRGRGVRSRGERPPTRGAP